MHLFPHPTMLGVVHWSVIFGTSYAWKQMTQRVLFTGARIEVNDMKHEFLGCLGNLTFDRWAKRVMSSQKFWHRDLKYKNFGPNFGQQKQLTF